MIHSHIGISYSPESATTSVAHHYLRSSYGTEIQQTRQDTCLKRNQVPSNAKHAQSPQGTLHQPEKAPDQTPLALWLARVHVAIQEQRPASEPRSAQAGCQLRVLQSRDQGEKHGLRGILQEVAVGALRTVELLRFGLGLNQLKSCHGTMFEEWRPEGMAHIGPALLNSRVAMRIRHFGFFADSGNDEAVDEAEDGNSTQGNADDGAVSTLWSDPLVPWHVSIVARFDLTRSFLGL